ncbi:MAG: thiamine pyrophosphate-binding protein, partial [Verrucomicrobiota bacterium]
MRGCDVMVRCLENLGVDTIFAYPGGASMELHQGLTRSKKIRTILPRHEQGGAFMAHGYARATGKPGVCMATSGPGATNLVTAIADAHMDSIPLICITGQVYQQFIGRAAFQETDFYGMTLPIVKHSFLVLDYNELPSIIYKAFKIATTGRPGPVVIDIPKDVQQHEWVPVFPKSPDDVEIPGLAVPPKAPDAELTQVLRLIEKAKQPVLYIGGGILSGNAHRELRAFAEATGIPVASTLMGLGGFPASHPQSLYWYGMHGTVAGNWAVCKSDLL